MWCLHSFSCIDLNICVAHVSIAKGLLLADTTLRHQPVHSRGTAMNTSPELNGTHFSAPILLCCHELCMVTFLIHFRRTKHFPLQDTDFDYPKSSRCVEFQKQFCCPFASAKSQAVFRFLSIYFVHSSSLFYAMTLPQNPTTTALDPASMGVIWEEAQEGISPPSLAGSVPFSTKVL